MNHPILPDDAILKKLTLTPGDVLVLTTDRDLSHAQGERIREILKTKFPKHESLVLSRGVSLSVMRRKDSRRGRLALSDS